MVSAAPMAKISIEDIRKELAASDWKVLTPKYENLNTLMTFECKEGHKITTTWKDIRGKHECPVCKSNPAIKMEDIATVPKRKGAYRILALDQSSRKTGYSVYDDKKLIGYGVYEAKANSPLERLVDLSDWLISMIRNWDPDEVGLEEVQHNQNVDMGHNVFKLLAMIMGALMITSARENVKITTVLISKWRGHCGVKGNKRADQKRSAQLLVKQWYDISLTDDAADAICIGKYFSDTHQGPLVIGQWQKM